MEIQADFYRNFYAKISNSTIHSKFCKSTYGIDLSQHGFADIKQLRFLIQSTGINNNHFILDVGCGNGMIAEYLSGCTGAFITGLDNCSEAINQAITRTKNKTDRLHFIEGDINNLCLESSIYDCILLIDSIYFSNDYNFSIAKLKHSLKTGGQIAFFYSIGPALLGTINFSNTILDANNTPLATALENNGLLIRYYDLTFQEYELAKQRKDFLIAHKDAFDREKLGFIYENRLADSVDDIKYIEQNLFKRYLYITEVNR